MCVCVCVRGVGAAAAVPRGVCACVLLGAPGVFSSIYVWQALRAAAAPPREHQRRLLAPPTPDTPRMYVVSQRVVVQASWTRRY